MSDTIELSGAQWEAWLSSLYERDDRLERREPGITYSPKEAVDAYVLSGHAEALRSAEVDGDLWGTLADLEEEAGDEEEAWAKITAFYLGRGCVLVRVAPGPEMEGPETEGADPQETGPEEWLLEEALARRLGLAGT